MLKKLFGAALFAALFILPCSAADVPIFPTGPIFQLTGLVWGTSTQPGFNNNYFFVPANINESVCVFVYNNNTTNPHTFNATISVSGNPNEKTPSDGTWQNAANSTGIFAATSPGFAGGIGGLISGASLVSINFSNSATQAGAPDTATVSIIQTTGNCFSGNNFIGSYPQSVMAMEAIQASSDGLSQSYVATQSVTNPLAGGLIDSVNANNGNRTLYIDKAVLSCTAACSLTLSGTNALGTTCTNNTPANIKIGSGVTSTATQQVSCATPAAAISPFTIDLAANTPFVVDLGGYIDIAQTLNGFEVTSSAVTGNVRVAIFWHEK